MNKKFDCNIINDLLPNYISSTTSFTTNKIIKEHINECTICKQKLLDMQENIELDNDNQNEFINEKNFNYLKKVHKKFFVTLIISILIMFISFIASVILTENNLDEAIFTFVILIFASVLIITKVILPILGIAVGISLFKNFKNVFIRIISLIITSISFYFVVINIIVDKF